MRNIFVISIIVAGLVASLRGPFYALLFYLWFAYFRPDGWLHSNWVTGLRMSLVVGIITLLMAVVKFNDLKPRLNAGVLLLLAALVQTFISAQDSVAPEWSWYWWVEFSKVIVIGVLITMVVNTPWRLRMAVLVIAVSLGFEAVKQGWAQLVLNPGGMNRNSHFVLGDNNGVALGMFMLAPLVGGLIATSKGLQRRFHQFFLGGVILRGISTYSRGGFLTALVTGLYATARSRYRLRVLAAVAVLSLLISAVMPDRFWDRMGTITATEEERDASSSGRLHFWRLATEMAAGDPWTGVGFNGFSRAYDEYDDSLGLYGRSRAVHSTWFGMLAENGYPGLLILVLLALLAFRNAWTAGKIARGTPEHEIIEPLARGFQGSLLGFVVGGTFINGHYNELGWHLFALTTALKGIAIDAAAARHAATSTAESSPSACDAA